MAKVAKSRRVGLEHKGERERTYPEVHHFWDVRRVSGTITMRSRLAKPIGTRIFSEDGKDTGKVPRNTIVCSL